MSIKNLADWNTDRVSTASSACSAPEEAASCATPEPGTPCATPEVEASSSCSSCSSCSAGE